MNRAAIHDACVALNRGRWSYEATCDFLLRKFGFAIHSRPRTGETLWRRGGEVITQREAVEIVRRQEEDG